MDQRLDQSIRQTFHLLLSPRMLATLKILSLPYIEMVNEIEKAAEENPVIEIETPDRLAEYLRYLESDKKAKKELSKTEYSGLENVKGQSQTLAEHLKEQLKLEAVEDKIAEIAGFLIDNLDSQGYLKDYVKLSKEIIDKQKVTRPEVDSALNILHSMEPEGVGARDLRECLLIQVKGHNFDSIEMEEVLEQVISGHLEDIAENNFEKIAKDLGIELDEVSQIVLFIKENLNPNPASNFGEESRQVIPSFAIELDASKKCYNIINLEEKYGPKITFSKTYEKMLKNPNTDKETVKFLKEKFDNAKELMENLLKRKQTAQQILKVILGSQEEFLNKGVKYFKPLEQKAIADVLGLHPSTISRAIADKYVQTPIGLFPIKYLCPREVVGSTAFSIKGILKDLIDQENASRPLSDADLVQKLGDRGFRLARRTVAAYRTSLGIPHSEERKKTS